MIRVELTETGVANIDNVIRVAEGGTFTVAVTKLSGSRNLGRLRSIIRPLTYDEAIMRGLSADLLRSYFTRVRRPAMGM